MTLVLTEKGHHLLDRLDEHFERQKDADEFTPRSGTWIVLSVLASSPGADEHMLMMAGGPGSGVHTEMKKAMDQLERDGFLIDEDE